MDQSIRVQSADTAWFATLIVVEQFGTFAAAARAMGVDEKTVRNHISAFEKWIGFSLIVRDGNKPKSPLKLTTKAIRMIGYLRDFFDFIEKSRSTSSLEDFLVHRTDTNGSFNISGRAVRDVNGDVSFFEID